MKKQEKLPVEQLQEEFLTGPADESLSAVAEALQVDKVVPVKGEAQLETIIFRNQRDPGHTLEFHYASKNVPFKQYKLVDGQKYTLPREVVRNLESCRENIEKYRKNAEGLPQIYVAGYKTHFVCERVA